MRTRITGNTTESACALSTAVYSPLAECGHARQLFDTKHILWITFIPYTLLRHCCFIVRFTRRTESVSAIEIFSLSTPQRSFYFSPDMDVDRVVRRQSGSFIRAKARRYASHVWKAITVRQNCQKGGRHIVRYYMPLPFLSKYPDTLFLSFSFSLFFFHLRTSIRNSLLLAILFDLPFDADYQTPVQSSLRVSLSRREYLETSQFSYLSVYIRISAQKEDRPSLLWPCRGKSEAITLGFYPGLPTRRCGRGVRSVANKRVKRRATR